MSYKKIKLILYPILYWIIFIAIPFIIAINLRNYNSASNMPAVIGSYILFIAPFLYFIPYKLTKFENIKEKLLYFIFGLVIPYFIIYIYVYYKISNMGAPHF